ncbi:hypothetical protein Tco_1399406 [Tanacetum coccineum]
MKQLELLSRFNITLPDCDSDSDTDGGDAHQGTNTSNSRAGESNSRAGEGEEDDHDSCMISRLSSSGKTGSFYPSSSYWAKSSMVSQATSGLNFLSLPPDALSMAIWVV